MIFEKPFAHFLCCIIAILCLTPKDSFSADKEDSLSSANFAFSHYLGTGFYTTSGQDVFVLQLPIQHTIIEKTNKKAGWVLNLPLTIGFINFNNVKVENLPDINDVENLTFVPGIEYQYPMSKDWTISTFLDYGFARSFNQDSNILVTGIGAKSYALFNLENSIFTLSNSILYAHEKSTTSNPSSDYTLIETGLNYRSPYTFSIKNNTIQTNLYYINFFYPKNLVFFERTTTPIKVGVNHEVGLTFSDIPGLWFFDKAEIGLGVRFGNGVSVIRLVLGSPF